jgi:serine/threonine-protein kinase RsbW
MFVCRKLIVDGGHELFDANGMSYAEYRSEFPRIREIASEIVSTCPSAFREDFLLEQQVSELVKNAVKHGNGCAPGKMVRVWSDFRKRVRLIVEDQGAGFRDLESWNDFYYKRQKALYDRDFDRFLDMASYRGPRSTDEDGGNSLIAALEYWNGGMIYNERRNKVGVVRWYSRGSA